MYKIGQCNVNDEDVISITLLQASDIIINKGMCSLQVH